MARIFIVYGILVASLTLVGGFAPFSRLNKPQIRRTRVPVLQERLPSVYVLDLSSATPFEVWCVSSLENWYSKSVTIKCPFFRRRAADILDALDLILRFLVIRHKTLDLDILPPLGSRTADSRNVVEAKTKNLEMSAIAEIIQNDWKVHSDKGYYITGRLTSCIYRDDCFFDGPDPDMPVKGLRKYLSAASQLFDHRQSSAELLSLTMQPDARTFTARWKMDGVLRLPWRPSLPQWTGSTLYVLDDDGLIYEHREHWDISVMEAFVKTITPWLGAHIWDEQFAEPISRS